MEQIKTQNLQGYEEYRNGEITRDQFASTKTQLEKEKLNLQKRIQEVLQKYVKAIYMHDDGRIEMCWKELK